MFAFSPVPVGSLVSSTFGLKEPFRDHAHRGVDFAVPIGTSVTAPSEGVVESVFWDDGGGGNVIFLLHANNLKTAYLHLSETYVKKGENVRAGQVIASSGNTGGSSTGAHLHFEVRNATTEDRVDPAKYLPNKFVLKSSVAVMLGISSIGGRTSLLLPLLGLLGLWYYIRKKRG